MTVVTIITDTQEHLSSTPADIDNMQQTGRMLPGIWRVALSCRHAVITAGYLAPRRTRLVKRPRYVAVPAI